MEFNRQKLTQKFTRYLLLSIFLVVYLLAFVFLFFNKGIYVDGHFYKKSANLTQITYTASSIGADFDEIVLEKYIDKSLITIDDKYTVSVFSAGSFDTVVSAPSAISHIDADWALIASQQGERIRGFGNKPWFAVVAVYVLFFLSKSTMYSCIHSFAKARQQEKNITAALTLPSLFFVCWR